MLVVKVFVNYDQIDEIWIQNVNDYGNGVYEYAIRKPEGDFPLVQHKRSEGYMPLVSRVLEIIDK